MPKFNILNVVGVDFLKTITKDFSDTEGGGNTAT